MKIFDVDKSIILLTTVYKFDADIFNIKYTVLFNTVLSINAFNLFVCITTCWNDVEI